jgi:predicted Zn-dependent peptidase
MPATAEDFGDKPQLSAPRPYKAPAPDVYKTPHGTKVWLLERSSLPMVSLTLSLPRGSTEDPAGKAGLAHITASMMDEGAGERGALEISTGINDLGASMWLSVSRDGSRLSLTVLKKFLPQAFEIFADVMARPRFEAKEWERVSKLWQNQLRRRVDSPRAVASVVSGAVMYGADTPYGHPASGILADASNITLDDVKAFYKRVWRPDEALLVVAGDITRSELDDLWKSRLGEWEPPATPPPAPTPPNGPSSKRPRLVLVDRANAPQAVVSVIAPGVAASDPSAPLLDLVNTALGGSFTSRLNQNLREDHGWTYGASSGFVETRGVGPFVARSAVFVNVTGAAIKEMLAEIEKMAQHGLTDEEFVKVRARDLTSLIETNETLNSLVGRLTTLGAMGMSYDFDAKASAARQAAEREALSALARKHLDQGNMSVVVVGPRDKIEPQLADLGLGEPELWSEEGRPLAAKKD